MATCPSCGRGGIKRRYGERACKRCGPLDAPAPPEPAMLDLSIQVYRERLEINCTQFNPKTPEDWSESRRGYRRLIAELQRIVDDGPAKCPFAPATAGAACPQR